MKRDCLLSSPPELLAEKSSLSPPPLFLPFFVFPFLVALPFFLLAILLRDWTGLESSSARGGMSSEDVSRCAARRRIDLPLSSESITFAREPPFTPRPSEGRLRLETTSSSSSSPLLSPLSI